jgi:hypothetical protein
VARESGVEQIASEGRRLALLEECRGVPISIQHVLNPIPSSTRPKCCTFCSRSPRLYSPALLIYVVEHGRATRRKDIRGELTDLVVCRRRAILETTSCPAVMCIDCRVACQVSGICFARETMPFSTATCRGMRSCQVGKVPAYLSMLKFRGVDGSRWARSWRGAAGNDTVARRHVMFRDVPSMVEVVEVGLLAQVVSKAVNSVPGKCTSYPLRASRSSWRCFLALQELHFRWEKVCSLTPVPYAKLRWSRVT